MRYTVKDTHIRHSEKTYGPGSVMELSEEEATPLLHHLEPVKEETEADDGEDSGEDRKRRKK